MLSVNNQRQIAVPLTAAAQAEAKAGEAAPKGRPLAASTDTVTISGRPEKPTVERPLNFANAFGEDEGLTVRLHNQLPPMFYEYASGNIDKESVLRALDHAVSDIVAYWGDKGLDPADITQDILQDVYECYRIDMVSSMSSASYVEGKEVAKEMGCTGFTVYYNSDYYYKSEDLIDTVHDHFEALSVKYGCGPMELPRDFPKGDIRNTRYASYNTGVNSALRGAGGSMIDWTIPPPKGFKMLFDSNCMGLNQYPPSMGEEIPGEPSLFDSAVHIQYQGWSFSHRLPTRMDPTRYPVSVHLMDVIRSSGKGYPKELEALLDNFDFYAINVGKLYTDAHPLKY